MHKGALALAIVGGIFVAISLLVIVITIILTATSRPRLSCRFCSSVTVMDGVKYHHIPPPPELKMYISKFVVGVSNVNVAL